VAAVTDVEAFTVYREDFLACCRRNPELSLRFLEIFGRRLRQLVNLVERITFGSVRQRLATTLLEFSATEGGAAFALPETQEQMASRLGTVREVVSRNLSRFQSEGLIRISRRDVEIVDPAGLRAEAETEI
jgi:CRP/FNR family transcriptional regulator